MTAGMATVGVQSSSIDAASADEDRMAMAISLAVNENMSVSYGISDVDFETGQKYYTEKIFDNEYQVASPSFFQVNISQVENIFSELLDQNI